MGNLHAQRIDRRDRPLRFFLRNALVEPSYDVYEVAGSL